MRLNTWTAPFPAAPVHQRSDTLAAEHDLAALAIQRLVKACQHSNIKMRDLAQQIIATGRLPQRAIRREVPGPSSPKYKGPMGKADSRSRSRA